MTIYELKDMLEKKKSRYPISSLFEKTHGQRRGVYWKNQKEHLISWLIAQDTLGSGRFSRDKINTDAERMYNRLACPECILWLCEAAGVPKAYVQVTAEKAKKFDKVVTRAAFIKHQIPWKEIETRMNTA